MREYLIRRIPLIIPTLFWLLHRVPLGFDRIDDAVTRFIRTAKSKGQRSILFIHNPTRDIFLLALHIVITHSMVASSQPFARAGRFPDALGPNPFPGVRLTLRRVAA
jgi:hypothetical protein